MSDTVIRVENLSKSYTIRHQTGERYTALRDVLANGAKTLGSRLMQAASSQRPAATSHQPPATSEEFWALNDISFEVKQGERVGIIGRNGAGKSTLLKILSRITEPTKGRVHIKGRVASLLEVGTGFHPELTGRENIYLNGAILGMSRAEIHRKFDEIVAFAEVEKFLDTPVKRYSSGMYVRLAFAVAAHLEPEVLVVDEVLAVGDATFQKKSIGKMESISKSGRTLLFVSHNMGAIRSLCKTVIWLDTGTIKNIGEANVVTNDYLSIFDQQGSSRQILKNQHVKGDQRVTIEYATLADCQGISKDSFLIGEPLQLQLHYQVNKQTEGTFWCLVSSADNNVLLSSFQKDTMLPSKLDQNGIARVAIANLAFLPGRYRITAGIFDALHNSLDWVEDILSFEILPHFADGRAFDHRYGVFTQQLEWEIE